MLLLLLFRRIFLLETSRHKFVWMCNWDSRESSFFIPITVGWKCYPLTEQISNQTNWNWRECTSTKLYKNIYINYSPVENCVMFLSTKCKPAPRTQQTQKNIIKYKNPITFLDRIFNYENLWLKIMKNEQTTTKGGWMFISMERWGWVSDFFHHKLFLKIKTNIHIHIICVIDFLNVGSVVQLHFFSNWSKCVNKIQKKKCNRLTL